MGAWPFSRPGAPTARHRKPREYAANIVDGITETGIAYGRGIGIGVPIMASVLLLTG